MATTRVIVLNSGSSAGKSGVARCLQAVLAEPWLTLGVGPLVDALPASTRASDAGIIAERAVVERIVTERVG
ncbi:hypothetical protein [Streptomyces sp. NBRC 109706]|uniref:phosphotransferase-like protein n=1 Tax=Streptomyces sp. NBRC 109706 TaxID=1550035 RepID=UPI0007801FD0